MLKPGCHVQGKKAINNAKSNGNANHEGKRRIERYRSFVSRYSPVVYYVEQNIQYSGLVDVIFSLIDQGTVIAVTSPVTLAECMIYPYRQGNIKLQQDFTDLIVRGNHTVFVSIDEQTGLKAAELRAQYNLTLPDALQVACALTAGCDAFLSNDITLKRISEPHVTQLAAFFLW